MILLASFFIFYLFQVAIVFLMMKKKFSNIKILYYIGYALPVFGLLIFIIYGKKYNPKSYLPTKKFELSNKLEIKNVKIYIFGKDFFETLVRDLLSANKKIYMSFYIFKNDEIGKKIIEILSLKSRLGVEVLLLYDNIGSINISKAFFNQLIKSGGKVKEFSEKCLFKKLFSATINYRMHRKLTIIDEEIVFIGGENIRNDHIGIKKELSPWRDNSFRFCNKNTALYFEKMFLYDFNFDNKNYAE